ncbi:CPBP family intramembrane glutamic endopeptidase [Planctobacterium marinum]|uniref:CAAX prenyl protease 2/Lysostaphin resistance protein A-like domain-containing protein n=1 Tax=Planctobacterium marinum TaxID=1631968 RepID=A0AA48I4P8_9ALTE|nr:hypothetical protein MACH26_14010 [Planctobacterium marinum]
MQLINRLSMSYPVFLSLILVLAFVLSAQLGALLLSNFMAETSASNISIFTRFAAASLMVVLLGRLGGLRTSGVSNPMRDWHKHWFVVSLTMLVVMALNFSIVRWSELSIAFAQIPMWALDHLAAGVFEEIMMRALVFFILARAWANKSNGLVKAAIAQAVIFGALHLLNLLNGWSMAVVMQVLYATFLGISFAGIVAFSRTVWPAVLLHAMINASGSLNRAFIVDYAEEPVSITLYLVFTSVIFIATTVPALLLLKRAADKETFGVKSSLNSLSYS